jgi:hypothetical protein
MSLKLSVDKVEPVLAGVGDPKLSVRKFELLPIDSRALDAFRQACRTAKGMNFDVISTAVPLAVEVRVSPSFQGSRQPNAARQEHSAGSRKWYQG